MDYQTLLEHRRFLVVEDDDIDFGLMSRSLLIAFDHPLEIERATGARDASEQLRAKRFDAVFVDHLLNDGTGLSILDAEASPMNATPFIMVTGMVSDELDIVALDRGADDFLDKDDIRPHVLRRVVPYAISAKKTLRRIEAARRSAEVLTQAHRDARERFLCEAQSLLSRARAASAELETADNSEHTRQALGTITTSINSLAVVLEEEEHRIQAEAPFKGFVDSLTNGLKKTGAIKSLGEAEA